LLLLLPTSTCSGEKWIPTSTFQIDCVGTSTSTFLGELVRLTSNTVFSMCLLSMLLLLMLCNSSFSREMRMSTSCF